MTFAYQTGDDLIIAEAILTLPDGWRDTLLSEYLEAFQMIKED